MHKILNRTQPKGIKLMSNHFTYLSEYAHLAVAVEPSPNVIRNSSGTKYKERRITKIMQARKKRQKNRAAWRARQARSA